MVAEYGELNKKKIGIFITPKAKSATARFSKKALVTVCNVLYLEKATITKVFPPQIRQRNITETICPANFVGFVDSQDEPVEFIPELHERQTSDKGMRQKSPA